MPPKVQPIPPRVGVAVLVGFLLFALTQMAAWRYRWAEQRSYDPRFRTWRLLTDLHTNIEQHKAKTGEYPNDLSAIKIPERWEHHREEDGTISDAWRQPLQYRVMSDGFELKSVGLDGKPGGPDYDADIFSDTPESEMDVLSLGDFARESVSRGYVWASTATAVVAMLIMLSPYSDGQKQPGWLALLGLAVITIIMSLAMGMFLMLFYLSHH